MDRPGDETRGTLFFGSIYSGFLLLLVCFALYLGALILAPFVGVFVLSTVLAILFYPLHARLMARTGGRATISAMLVTLLIAFAILIPIIFFLLSLIGQGVQSVTSISHWLARTDINALVDSGPVATALEWVRQNLPFVKIEELNLQAKAMNFFQQFGQGLIGMSTNLVANTASLAFKFALVVFVVFYFLRDGEKLVARFKYLIPLRPSQVDAVADGLKRVVRSLILGTVLIAVLQGVVGGIALAVVDIPALFWGTMMAFASFIPVVGSSIIWLPAAVYLVIIGSWKWAVFLVLWCVLIVASIDTFLRPFFIKNAAKVSILFVFLSILGGLSAFGPMGLIYGPLILSFAMAMLEIYGEEYRDALTGKGRGVFVASVPTAVAAHPSGEQASGEQAPVEQPPREPAPEE